MKPPFSIVLIELNANIRFDSGLYTQTCAKQDPNLPVSPTVLDGVYLVICGDPNSHLYTKMFEYLGTAGAHEQIANSNYRYPNKQRKKGRKKESNSLTTSTYSAYMCSQQYSHARLPFFGGDFK